MEVQSKAGAADLAKMRATLGARLDWVKCSCGGHDVLVRMAKPLGGELAQQQAVSKVRGALVMETIAEWKSWPSRLRANFCPTV